MDILVHRCNIVQQIVLDKMCIQNSCRTFYLEGGKSQLMAYNLDENYPRVQFLQLLTLYSLLTLNFNILKYI